MTHIQDDIETVRKALEPFADPFQTVAARSALDRLVAERDRLIQALEISYPQEVTS